MPGKASTETSAKTLVITARQLQSLENKAKLLASLGPSVAIAILARENGPCTLACYQYGAVLVKNARRTLYSTHIAGLFSCLCTIMWTIRQVQASAGELPETINNRFGMRWNKTWLQSKSFGKHFVDPSPASLSALEALPPGEPVFNHHGSYAGLFGQQLQADWLRAYFDCYMKPTDALRQRIEHLTTKYKLTARRTVVTCYRGTDKKIEVVPDPLDMYIAATRKMMAETDAEQILIQTDQTQVRDEFRRIFGGSCIFIEELPTTEGSVVMHLTNDKLPDRDAWTMDLLAMCFALSACRGIVTHTGNVGFFLAMMAMLNGAKVVQLK
jgi:hypothetical protein